MEILNLLFPEFEKRKNDGIPKWDDLGVPWEIIDDGELGIKSQILKIVEDGIFIHPTATIGENVTIEGPCYIGKDVVIRHNAYLRGGSWICDGSLVGHSTEIKNSILLPNSNAPHFNYVGDSIIGFGVNLGAGVKLSNVRNDRSEIIVDAGKFGRIPTGMRKLGALVGDHSQIGCNVVTNPGTIIHPDSMIRPNETVSGYFYTK